MTRTAPERLRVGNHLSRATQTDNYDYVNLQYTDHLKLFIRHTHNQLLPAQSPAFDRENLLKDQYILLNGNVFNYSHRDAETIRVEKERQIRTRMKCDRLHLAAALLHLRFVKYVYALKEGDLILLTLTLNICLGERVCLSWS